MVRTSLPLVLFNLWINSLLLAQSFFLNSSYTDPPTDFQQWLEQFERLWYQPVNLLTAQEEDLTFLPWISTVTALQILHQIRTGNITHLDQICQQFRFSDWQCEIFQSIFTLDPLINQISTFQLRCRYTTWLTVPRAIQTGTFLGDYTSIRNQLSLYYPKGTIYIQFDKQAGEPLNAGTITGTISYNAALWKIYAGYFGARVGFGNLLWSGIRPRKSSQVISPVLRLAFQLQPYRTFPVSQVWRGIGTIGSIPLSSSATLQVMGWLSWQQRSGTVDSSGAIRSLNIAEQFRTLTEYRSRHTIEESSLGIATELHSTNFRSGTALLLMRYNRNFLSSSRYTPPAHQFAAVTAYARWSHRTVAIGGEATLLSRYQVGLRIGYQYQPTDYLRFALLFRYFSPYYRMPMGATFGQWSPPGNEIGWYAGIQLRTPTGQWYIYGDLYRSLTPLVSYSTTTSGADFRLGFQQYQAQYPLWLEIRGRYQEQARKQNRFPLYTAQLFLQLTIPVSPSSTLQLRSLHKVRLPQPTTLQSPTYGTVLLARFRTRLPILPVECAAQLTAYALDSLTTWIWEPSLRQSWRLGTLQHRGTELVLLLRWSETPTFCFELRWKYRHRFQKQVSGREPMGTTSAHQLEWQVTASW